MMSSTDTGYTDEKLEASQAVPINKIDDYLYLGNVEARNEENLNEHQIGRVIGILTQQQQLKTNPISSEMVKETIFYLADSPTASIIPIVEWAIPLIEQSIKEKENVLIHCWQGVSRSASVLIGYLIKVRKMSAKEALAFVEKGRICVWPNNAFWNELVTLEEMN